MKRVLGKGLEALIPGAAPDEQLIAEQGGMNLIREIPLKNIKPSPFQPRLSFDKVKLHELAQSIEARGIIQPIVVRAVGDDYELIVGERRLRAVEMLGRSTIPAVINETVSNEEAMELTLIENIQRADLNPVEEAQAYYRLMTECNLAQAEVAVKVGKERSSVANSIRLLSLPRDVLNLVSEGKLSAGHGRALLTVPIDAEKSALAQKVIAEEMSVRDLEKIVYADRGNKKTGRIRPRSAQIVALEEDLKRLFGTKVILTQRRKGGRIAIEYYSNEELERLLKLFGIQDQTS